MTSPNPHGHTHHDSHGWYTPSIPNIGIPRCGPIPPFHDEPPYCDADPQCAPTDRRCQDHKYVLYIKPKGGNDPFEIPHGRWENWDWYTDRICEHGYDRDTFIIIFAGCLCWGPSRHSGLQFGSNIMLITDSDPSFDNLKAKIQEIQAKEEQKKLEAQDNQNDASSSES